MKGVLISKNCKLASVILWRSYSFCSFYEKVGYLKDCPFRRLDRTLSAYERNTGKVHPLALKRGHSKERRNTFIIPLTSFSEVQWTGEVAVGTSPNGTSSEALTGQSLFRVAQRSKLTT